MKLGIEKTAMIRVRAGISYALTEAMDEGHCGLPVEELGPLAVELLDVPKELIQTALDLELAEGTVIADAVGETRCVFLAGLYRSEQAIAERLRKLVSGKLPWAWIDTDKALPWIEQKTGLSLAPTQNEAIRLALMARLLVITGGPGVGKTTIVNSILRILAAKGVNLLLCAPTGRAAKRMTEVGCEFLCRLGDYGPTHSLSALLEYYNTVIKRDAICCSGEFGGLKRSHRMERVDLIDLLLCKFDECTRPA